MSAVQLSEQELAGGGAVQSERKRTLIAGLGDTGLAAARWLLQRGETVRVIDSRASPPGLACLRAEFPDAEVVLETLDSRWLEGASRVVLSPGLSSDEPIAVAAREQGIPVVSEVELFAAAAHAPVLAVTGSNGKSTVTTLAARMLAACGLDAPAGGNLGPPALELLRGAADAYVLEISSFQMETTHGLRPRAAACLNVSADHLDRHRTLERYAALKERLLTAAEHAIVNIDDPLAAAMGARHPHSIAVSIERSLPTGFSIVSQRGERWLGQDGRPLIAASRIALAGRHNEANALAALALVSTLVDDLAPAVAVLEEFGGLPHRCQRVAVRGGVTFVNDSKGTNVGATLAALQGLRGPLVLIAGGLAKGQDLSPLALAALGKVKAAVLIGAAAAELDELLNPVCETRRADSIEAAVRTAAALARPGDTVLLSPACASLDMFRDYRERGERFARAAEGLPA